LNLEMLLNAMRCAGWRVAVHNDYSQVGKLYTFWLFTHAESGRFVRGEAESDLLAVREAFEQATRVVVSRPSVSHKELEQVTYEKPMTVGPSEQPNPSKPILRSWSLDAISDWHCTRCGVLIQEPVAFVVDHSSSPDAPFSVRVRHVIGSSICRP
jgi:hypothetical protein